jgi:hypothetical protein
MQLHTIGIAPARPFFIWLGSTNAARLWCARSFPASNWKRFPSHASAWAFDVGDITAICCTQYERFECGARTVVLAGRLRNEALVWQFLRRMLICRDAKLDEARKQRAVEAVKKYKNTLTSNERIAAFAAWFSEEEVGWKRYTQRAFDGYGSCTLERLQA